MKRFILGILFLFTIAAGAGTSVGNFNFVTQYSFDFRLGYPNPWTWKKVSSTDPNEVENWYISNNGSVTDPNRVSSAAVAFMDNFPAKNSQELLREIQKRHPQLQWKPNTNPDFSVSFVSNQVFITPDKTQSFEYYFSELNKVVRIESIRDSFKNGAAELDTILSTIRRPSGYPQILSITSLQPNQTQVNVGDNFCYKMELDLRRNDFTKENLTSFDIKGAPDHWSFKSIQWNQAESSMVVCMKVTQRFGSDGLSIRSLVISGSGGAYTYCHLMTSSQLECQRGSQVEKVNYTVPTVNNKNPDTQGPKISSVQVGTKPNSIKFDASDVSGLSIGSITLDSSHMPPDKDSLVIYDDQMKQSPFEIEIKSSRLFPGYTRVINVILHDSVGNSSQLKAEEGQMNYMLYSSGSNPIETKIPVISIMRGL
jgi:hypothetical protein